MKVKYTKANPAPNMFKRIEAIIILSRKIFTQDCFKKASVQQIPFVVRRKP